MKRWLIASLAAGLVLSVPVAAEAATVGYLGTGTKAERMLVGLFVKDRQAIKRLSFREIPMRCEGGRRYRIDGRRFGKAIRLDSDNDFRARGQGDFPDGTEVARAKGTLRARRGVVRGVLRVVARQDNGRTCKSGRQPWRARAG